MSCDRTADAARHSPGLLVGAAPWRPQPGLGLCSPLWPVTPGSPSAPQGASGLLRKESGVWRRSCVSRHLSLFPGHLFGGISDWSVHGSLAFLGSLGFPAGAALRSSPDSPG